MTESQVKMNADAYEASRGGLGSSRIQVENKDTTLDLTNRTGISKFSSLMSSSFLTATTAMSLVTDTANTFPKSIDSSGSESSDAAAKSLKHKKTSKAKLLDDEKAARKEKKKAKKEKRRKMNDDTQSSEPQDADPEDPEARKKRRKQEKAQRRALNEQEVTQL